MEVVRHREECYDQIIYLMIKQKLRLLRFARNDKNS